MSKEIKNAIENMQKIVDGFAVVWRQQPKWLSFIVVLFLLAQISFLASLILPWKLLVLLSSESIPVFSPVFSINMSENALIVGLFVLIMAALILYLLSQIGSTMMIEAGAKKLSQSANKTGLFTNHAKASIRYYSSIAQASSTLFFCGLVLLLLLFIYPLLFVALLTYAVVWLACYWVIVKEYLSMPRVLLDIKPNVIAKLWWMLGFLFCVVFVMADFFQAGLNNVLIVFVCLILLRQVLIHSSSLYSQFGVILAHNDKILALFKSGYAWSEGNYDLPEFNGSLSRLIHPDTRESELRNILKELIHDSTHIESSSCRLAYSGKMLYVHVVLTSNQQTHAMLCKVYTTELSARAEHEQLLLECTSSDFFPHIKGVGCTEDVFWLALACDENFAYLESTRRNQLIPVLRAQLMGLTLPCDLIERYKASRKSLLQRLALIHPHVLSRFAVSQTQLDDCEWLGKYWDEIIFSISALPNQVILPQLGSRVMSESQHQHAVVYNVTLWQWDLLGCNWPVNQKITVLQQAIETAGNKRPELLGTCIHKVQLVALLYDFDAQYSKHDYTSSILRIAKIKQAFTALALD